MSDRSTAMLIALGLAFGSAVMAQPAVAASTQAEPHDWRLVADQADRDRLRRWRVTFLAALAKAKIKHAAELAPAGPLLQPDAAIDDPLPPAGDYRCRTVKIGGKTGAVPDFVADPAQPCRIDEPEGTLRLRITQGPQRPHGLFYADGRTRMVFLGTIQLGDESRAMRYGQDAERDLAGLLERIAPGRWRLIMPDPHWQSMLDVMEIVPAG